MYLDCQISSLDYYDGDLRRTPHHYCGLRQLTLPTSNTSVAMFETTHHYYEDLNEVKINYKSMAQGGLKAGLLYMAQGGLKAGLLYIV